MVLLRGAILVSQYMAQKILIIIILGLLALGIAAWAPWVTEEFAGTAALEAFTSAWEGVQDGCGFNCQGCGPQDSRWAPFGRLVRIEFACGLLPADLPEFHRQAVVFVSALGTVHGIPMP